MPTNRINQGDEDLMHFVTMTIVEWIDIFTKPEYFRIIIDSLKYCQKNKGLYLYEYAIMTNHIHLIVQAHEGCLLSNIVRDFKRHTTKKILELLEKDNRKYILNLIKNSFSRKKGNEKQIWQRENFPEAIETEAFLNAKIDYIYYNPVKKEYVKKPEDWLYSSARNRILSDNSVIELDNYEDIDCRLY